MKKLLISSILSCIAAVMILISPAQVNAANREKVLLDADMVELFDDGVAMLMLATSPKIDLLGVTVVTGNTWAEDGTAFTIRQLEGIGKTDIPVAMGNVRPEMIKRFSKIDEETHKFGRGHDSHMGAAGYDKPSDWLTSYRNNYAVEPTFKPVDESAVDLIIRTIKENPGEVTIAAIGPCTNLAAAIEKSPEIVSMAKRIVYMSGSFFQQGNVTPAAEFNVWIDPESAKKVMRAPWKEQIIVPLDACEKMRLSYNDFNNLRNKIKNPLYSMMMSRHRLNKVFESGEGATFIWDVLTAALIIDPSVITEEVTMPIDVNDVYSPSYGQTLAYTTVAPEGTQKARIIKTINQEKIMKMINEVFDKL